MNKFFAGRLLLAFLVTIGLFGVMSYNAPKAFAVTSFTATNVTLDPASSLVQWDFDASIYGSGPSGGLSWRIVEPSGNAIWYETTVGTCVSAGGSIIHCSYSVLPVKDDASVTQVRLEAGGSGGYTSQILDYPLPLPKVSQPTHPSAWGGWQYDVSNWTYASADSPTFTATASGDLTDIYSPGMRVKLTQSSTKKYFLITDVSYSSPNTTITLYGGTDYTLTNAAISKVYISSHKAPYGFPLNPAKWTVEVKDATYQGQSNPTANTWYNATNITLPIGSWNVNYQANLFGAINSNNVVVHSTLSTANNSESDDDFTAATYDYAAGTTTVRHSSTVNREKNLDVSSKTTYYLNYRTPTGTVSEVGIDGTSGGSGSKTIIRAVSTYL